MNRIVAMRRPARSRVLVALAWCLLAGVLLPGGSLAAARGGPGASGSVVSSAPRDVISPAYARVFHSGPRTQKVIALTFDDGYSATQTLAILRILRDEQVMATFFPYARAVAASPSAWRQVAAAGYPIGNHTYSHVNLTHLSSAGVISELTSARSTIAHITGRREPAIMRPPYGAYSTATRHAAALAGYPTVAMWDIDTRDWSGISSSTIVSRAIAGTNGSIVLMHAGPANTPGALRRIIASYRSRGYRFVTVPQLLGIAWP